ncbi:MAG: hypothetical protein GY820_12440, partial [Gammaproteobacteria bacterium]|nr:hypothetical protein [Gammaproteobacteria bacterium]
MPTEEQPPSNNTIPASSSELATAEQQINTEPPPIGDLTEAYNTKVLQLQLRDRELQEVRAQLARMMQASSVLPVSQPETQVAQPLTVQQPFSVQRQPDTIPFFSHNQLPYQPQPTTQQNFLQQQPPPPMGGIQGPVGTPAGTRPLGIFPDGTGTTGIRPEQAQPFAAPLVTNQATPAYAGVSWDAQPPGDCPQQVDHGPMHHQHHSGTAGGRCCNQLPPLKPFDPEQGKREFEMFELEFQERMKLENIHYSLWGRRLFFFLEGEARSFAFRWLKSQSEGQWNFHTLIEALRLNFQVENTPESFQRKLASLMWDPTKTPIEKHLSLLRTTVMQAFPDVTAHWEKITRQHLISSMPGSFVEFVTGRTTETLDALVKGIRQVAQIKEDQGTLKTFSEDKRQLAKPAPIPVKKATAAGMELDSGMNYNTPSELSITTLQSQIPSKFQSIPTQLPQNVFQQGQTGRPPLGGGRSQTHFLIRARGGREPSSVVTNVVGKITGVENVLPTEERTDHHNSHHDHRTTMGQTVSLVTILRKISSRHLFTNHNPIIRLLSSHHISRIMQIRKIINSQ